MTTLRIMRGMQSAPPIEIRPVDIEDLEALRALEAPYLDRHERGACVDAASLRHYARSGHAFAARRDGVVVGTVLAHAVWDGARPVVRASRLVAAGDDATVLGRLLEALVKSAYDAAVYDLVVELPAGDAAGRSATEATAFVERPLRRFERVLGSRAAAGA